METEQWQYYMLCFWEPSSITIYRIRLVCRVGLWPDLGTGSGVMCWVGHASSVTVSCVRPSMQFQRQQAGLDPLHGLTPLQLDWALPHGPSDGPVGSDQPMGLGLAHESQPWYTAPGSQAPSPGPWILDPKPPTLAHGPQLSSSQPGPQPPSPQAWFLALTPPSPVHSPQFHAPIL